MLDVHILCVGKLKEKFYMEGGRGVCQNAWAAIAASP